MTRPADSKTCPKCGSPVRDCRTQTRGEMTGAMETEWECGTWVEFDTNFPGDQIIYPIDSLRGAMHQHPQCKLNAILKALAELREEVSGVAQKTEDAYNDDDFEGDLDSEEMRAELLWEFGRRIGKITQDYLLANPPEPSVPY